MAQIKVAVINPFKKEVRIKMIDNTLEGMQAEVGGLIERGPSFDNGDEIYVNEEGLLQQYFDEAGQPIHAPGFFCDAWFPNPLVGQAVIVGNDGSGWTNMKPETLEDLYAQARKGKFRWVKVDTDAQKFYPA